MLNQPDFSRGTDGLLPAIAQDAVSGQVLMLAWMNAEAWMETLSTGRAVYFSRSRSRLWRKGEESGHFQELVEARTDCDADTILLKVHQTGAACHEGYASCFFRRWDVATESFQICEPQWKRPEDIYSNLK
ncbi:MAG: phosphoribosyl-AMP cyclohydrolase [Pirellulaceae bacterium]|jgi:phosphoribosyl-AMP cyclohydrolase|nr:phosphoribosyl-AMP cyclohydrolase [Pirellulaceae bacterium]